MENLPLLCCDGPGVTLAKSARSNGQRIFIKVSGSTKEPSGSTGTIMKSTEWGRFQFNFLPSPGLTYEVATRLIEMFRLFASHSEDEEKVELLDVRQSVPAQVPRDSAPDSRAVDEQWNRFGRPTASGPTSASTSERVRGFMVSCSIL
jgi:hypothetical protein